MTNGADGESRADAKRQSARLRARDAALQRTRAIVVGIAAGAIGLSGVFSVVAAHAFKGRTQRATPTATTQAQPSGPSVPGPDAVPPIAGDPAPLQPPAQPPATPAPQPSSPVPTPQVSGGS
jgi:hypothetical protein